ncbi:MAG: DnaJ C-terminal domain-containing protein [Myxococcota bacterium]
MNRRDYYATLGVPRGAPPDEIRKAYRALARRFHPDLNPDDPDTAEQFHQITEAYNTLIDTEKRQQYDRLGMLYKPDGQPPSADDIGQFVGQTIARIFRNNPKDVKGSDIEHPIEVTFEDVSSGTVKSISYRRECQCDNCDGSGATFDGKETCDLCNGSGKVNGRLFKSQCKRCDGKGYIITKRCKKCGGNGRINKDAEVDIKIPAGVQDGHRLRIRKAGNDSLGQAESGDFYALIQIQAHPLFKRRGCDIFADVPLLWTEAILGCSLKVPTLEGITEIRIPSQTNSHQVFRLAGRGLPSFDGKMRGDLQVRVMIETPTNLSPQQRTLILKLQENSDSMHPLRHQYDEHLRNRGS